MAAITPVQTHSWPMHTRMGAVAVTWPEQPLLVAGAVGGPLVIGVLTPLRNACTLAAQDSRATVREIFRRVFSRGMFSGWTGLTGPSCAAAVQFTTLGPGYFLYLELLGSPAQALVAGALTETLICYGPTTRNAQLMHNSVARQATKVPMRPLFPIGPGFTALLFRNVCSNAGIRVLSDPFSSLVAQATGKERNMEPAEISEACRMSGDFLASVCCGGISMPFNQLFNYHVTSLASIGGGPQERMQLSLKFLKSQYLVPSEHGSLRLSRIVLRDGFLRSFYIGCVFSSYAAVERLALSLLRTEEGSNKK